MHHRHKRLSLREFIRRSSKRRIAKALGVTYQTVCNWEDLETMPTYVSMSVILRLTKGRISLKQSRLEYLEKREQEIGAAVKKALRNLGGVADFSIRPNDVKKIGRPKKLKMVGGRPMTKERKAFLKRARKKIADIQKRSESKHKPHKKILMNIRKKKSSKKSKR
jgi:hypothetical protein